MKTAILYIRVSTDEQADKGYSLRHQEEILRKYSQLNGIEISKVVQEDHSAKTFSRPEWKKLLLELRKRRKNPDLILFTKWDRFSRNAGDAYQMINTLEKLGVEPQAVEQPLDLSVPENKMMLAFYLAAPEVENDRRALNTLYGMRRARKEGRWMGVAPRGYINRTDEAGRKSIVPKEPDASILKWAFEELALGQYSTDQIRKMANKKGLKCSKSFFYTVVRNPVYCGKIEVPKYKDEEYQLVPGQHEPIVSETLFYKVQEVLDGRTVKPRAKIDTDEMLPLRNFLVCPKCGKQLTGSASTSQQKKHYFYYHCVSACGFRTRANVANGLFENELKRFRLHNAAKELYRKVIKDVYTKFTAGGRTAKQEILSEIKRHNERLGSAREKFLDNLLDAEDYRLIKEESRRKLDM
ncbi:recombinase family protein [Belliella sp. DSM 111904]|uniref:Recombinase family protein n=1 Tax=Belliella filtrata TaxID=2923435 RepID=A0ABS9V4X2_9BACT|nr:recombinase family protein [Belliella filtrata]MCH7411264.1 recombinase family protein [Belliella filtrata]